jgi:hypothetical protein
MGGTERVLWGARAAIGFHQLSVTRSGEKFEDRRCVTARDDPGIRVEAERQDVFGPRGARIDGASAVPR